jgi:hypothetical protein
MEPDWQPERGPIELDGPEFAGKWVAVKDGEIIACATNARGLVPQLHELGDRGHAAVAQHVPHYSEAIIIGVG